MPTMRQWLEFLTNRCHTLELVEGAGSKHTNFKKDRKVSLATTMQAPCAYCQGQHLRYRCEEFTRLPVHTRQSEAVKRQLCINCLKKGHYARDCKGSKCRQCSKQHNTLLHQDRGNSSRTKEEGTAQETAVIAKSDQEDPKTVSVATVHCWQKQDELIRQWTYSESPSEDKACIAHAREGESQVVLSTAQVYLFDSQGNPRRCRVLLDPGSQSNLITKSFANKLNLPSKKVDIPILGINQGRSNIKELVKVKLKSIINNYQAPIECLVLETITQPLPQVQLNSQVLSIPRDMRLADPSYDTPGRIDLLIGAGLFWQLLCVGRIDLGRGQPILQKTLLGWVLGGEVKKKAQPGMVTACCLTLNQEIDQALEKFWRMEEVNVKQYPTKEEKQCEQHYIETVRRAPDGRFIVRLPMDSAARLGDSRSGALRRLYTTERKLRAQPDLKEEYIKFLADYEAMGDMTLVRGDSITDSQKVYYLPHQPVVRTTSLTTKLRVVFDGSARTSLGTSLNNKLLTGPNLQEDLADIILRFRCHQYVLTADVAMMFRQIMIAEADRDFQRILWRSDPCQPIQEYSLNTVTYGTSCAPYLAMRCLRQLAMEESSKMPRASKALLEDCYMDDVLTGCETFTEAVELQQQLYKLLAKGRFPLRKWRCNKSEVLEHLTEENRTEDLMILDSGEPLKTLGLLWNAAEDTLQYSVSIEEGIKPTKRYILSQIARIYDPLGLLGPIMMNAKMIMQELWKLQLAWDDSIPQSLYSIWCQYYSSLSKINQIKIPRNVNPRNTSRRIDLHGFSDASEKGYGACVYCTYTDTGGQTASHNLYSKSRVAPLKTMSLPRLELSGALILARLIAMIWKALGDRVGNTWLWSDSTIVLCWVGTQPHTLKTFVANRIAEIQELTPKIPWLYVPSSENTADMLSRGTPVSSLNGNELWWSGPQWLTTSDKWPEQPVGRKQEILEQRINTMVVTYSPPDVLRKFSQYSKLQRLIAYCLRFSNNVKGNRKSGFLAKEELQNAGIAILCMIQKERFQLELRQLQCHQELSSKSTLITLKPFLDDDGLLQVGGRLRHADIPETQRHPIVLPSKHIITTLIMQQEHRRLLHCGPELLLHSIRQQYWPLSGRRVARKVTRNCLQYFRYRPTPMKTIMADVPKSRLQALSRPFDRCGIDYAGPFTLRESKRRGRVPTTKAYVAVFVCFVTKALHLELVTCLTSEAFLAALRRFVSRRGTPSHIYSDNATNFVGANRELKELYVFLREQNQGIAKNLATQDITWHFIPPRSPHFGSLWESAVKSVKRHISIAMRGLIYTYEE